MNNFNVSCLAVVPLFFVLVFKNIGGYVFLSGFVSLFTLFYVV